jgi:hypothetical protein
VAVVSVCIALFIVGVGLFLGLALARKLGAMQKFLKTLENMNFRETKTISVSYITELRSLTNQMNQIVSL